MMSYITEATSVQQWAGYGLLADQASDLDVDGFRDAMIAAHEAAGSFDPDAVDPERVAAEFIDRRDTSR